MALITGSVVGGTAAAAKLGGLTKLLSVINPFTLKGALATGTALTGAGMLAGVPNAVEESILEQGKNKATGRFNTGLLAGALDLLDGEGDRFTQAGLQRKAD